MNTARPLRIGAIIAALALVAGVSSFQDPAAADLEDAAGAAPSAPGLDSWAVPHAVAVLASPLQVTTDGRARVRG